MMQNNVPIQQFLFLVIATILNVALGCHTYKFERGPTKNQNSQVGLILQSGLRGQDSNKKHLQPYYRQGTPVDGESSCNTLG